MRPAELDALIGQGVEAVRDALNKRPSQQFLSDEERTVLNKALTKMESIEATPEEPEPTPEPDLKEKPKAEKSVAASPRRSAGKKG